MANSYLNIVTFLLTTLFYYLAIKPSYTYEISIDPTKQKEYKSKHQPQRLWLTIGAVRFPQALAFGFYH